MVPSRLESTSGQSRLFLSLAKWSSSHHCSFITPSFIVVSISAPTTVTMVAVVCLLWMFLRYVSRDVVSYYTVLLGRWSLHLVHCWSQSLWLWFWSCKNGLAYINGTRTNRPLLAAREYPRESVQLHLQTRGRQAHAGRYNVVCRKGGDVAAAAAAGTSGTSSGSMAKKMSVGHKWHCTASSAYAQH